jgi:hypothetical protein
MKFFKPIKLVGISFSLFMFFSVNLWSMELNDSGPLTLTGKLETRNTFRIEGSDEYRWPQAQAGDMVQQRNTLQLELDHDLGIIGDSDISIKYHLVGKAWYDGIFDYGPSVWQDARETSPAVKEGIDDYKWDVALREGYMDFSTGPAFLRIGRQNLAWGETDAKRLLDGINPLDNTTPFLKLDDRRVPLWMARGTYNLGNVGFLSSLNIESFISPCFGSIGDRVGPVTPVGSPYSFAESAPSSELISGSGIPLGSYLDAPSSDLKDARWGFRLGGIIGDNLGFTLAHYKSYQDNAQPVLIRNDKQTFSNSSNQTAYASLISGSTNATVVTATATALAGGTSALLSTAQNDYLNALGSMDIFADSYTQKMVYNDILVTGGSINYWVESLDFVLRSEVAYFQDEAFFTEEDNLNLILDEANLISTLSEDGQLPTSDVIRYAVGVDKMFWIRALNPNVRFTLIAQYFGAYIQDYDDDFCLPLTNPDTGTYDRVKRYEQAMTLNLQTTYRNGTIKPELSIQYDPRGNWAFQPSCELERNMWRYKIEGTIGVANSMTGTGAARDRDEIAFTISYLLR